MPDPGSLTTPPCLLLTATIQVRDDIRMTLRRDTDTRLADYKEAFRKWMGNPAIRSIVFVENSGFDLSPFEDIARKHPEKQVELLSFECPPFNGQQGGKSYGEMLCFEYCLAHSELVPGASSLLKITGRYHVANIDSVVRYMTQHPELDVVCNFYRNLTWADSRVFGATPAFVREYLLPMREQINEQTDLGMEQVLARAIHKAMSDGRRWSATPQTPEVHGISGTLGHAYALNRFRQRLRHKILLNIMAR